MLTELKALIPHLLSVGLMFLVRPTLTAAVVNRAWTAASQVLQEAGA